MVSFSSSDFTLVMATQAQAYNSWFLLIILAPNTNTSGKLPRNSENFAANLGTCGPGLASLLVDQLAQAGLALTLLPGKKFPAILGC